MKFYSLFFVFFLLACQNMQKESFSYENLEDQPDVSENSQASEESLSSGGDRASLAESLKAHHKFSYEDVSIEERPEVDVWIRYFQGRGRDNMRLYLERSRRYMSLMRSVLKKAGLPEKLVYVAMIESGFSPVARSRAQAVGYWQFIRATGRRYGLKVDQFVDERRDPLLSTAAAGKYLKDLYSLFGSWYLAMASYNAGEYRVNRAMMRHYTRDFWKLRRRRSIPRETREYVPKFMAAYLISQNPEKYGFHNLNYQKPIEFESVAFHQPLSLKKLSRELSLSYTELKMLNPKYVSEYVPLEKTGSVILRVPKNFSEKITVKVAEAVKMSRPKHAKTYTYYKVRWGDNLFKLARRNRTTVNTIARMNGFSSKKMLKAGQVIKLPKRYRFYSQNKSRKSHKVKKGESLRVIAKKYGVRVGQLKSWNNLSSSIIHPNQILRLQKAVKKSSAKVHIVKRGDTLVGIAKKYRVPLVSLMKKNSLTFKSILQIGRSIRIPE